MGQNEMPFRCIGLAVLAMFLIVRGHFMRRAAREPVVAGRRQDRHRHYYRLVGASFLATPVYALTTKLDFAHLGMPTEVRWIGVGVALLGVALISWTHGCLGRNWSGILELRENHRLVDSGPYRHIRHPMYSAFFLVVIGVGLVSANLVLAALQIGAVTAMYWARVADEEAMMVDHFGNEYRQYMQRTGRLLPRLRATSTDPKGRSRFETRFVRLQTTVCKACWSCLRECPVGVMGKIDLPWHAHALLRAPEACVGCLKCVAACEHGALVERVDPHRLGPGAGTDAQAGSALGDAKPLRDRSARIAS